MIERINNSKEDIYNSSNNHNRKGMAKVSFYTYEERLIYEFHYSLNTSIEELIKDFISKNLNKILLNYFKEGKNFNKENLRYYLKFNNNYEKLEIDKQIISFYLEKIQDTSLMYIEAGKSTLSNSNGSSMTIPQKYKHLIIYVKNESKKFYISEDIDSYIINNSHLIGKLMMNELKYFIYNKNSSETKIIKCTRDESKKMKIKFFSRKSVYCNAKNKLYIYEGSDYSQNNNKFIEINLINHNIEIISYKFPQRILHSMIFIPENYIFIIGGKNTKEILIYNLQNNDENYEKYPHLLPKELLEPSLITINNKYLYAFENSTFRFLIFRADIISISPFEEIKISNSLNINQKFFGLVKNKNKNSIIFLGGQILDLNKNNNINNSNNCFEFDYITNKLYMSHREYQNLDFLEKTFIPMQRDAYMQIADFKYKNEYIPKVLLFYENIQSIQNGSIEQNQINPRFSQKGFKSVESNNIKISVSDNIVSIIATSSYGELPVPLYNNK